MHRVLDTSERVKTAGQGPNSVRLAFQYALGVPPRWMDPRHPAQIDLDLSYEDSDADRALLDRLGAIRLRGHVHAQRMGGPGRPPLLRPRPR